MTERSTLLPSLQDLTEQVGDLLAARPAIAEHMELVEEWAGEFTRTQSLMLEQLRVTIEKCDALELNVRTMREELGGRLVARCPKCGKVDAPGSRKCEWGGIYCGGCGWATDESLWG